MFIAGDLEGDATLIEEIITVMEAARVGACPSRQSTDPPVRLGEISFRGHAVPETAVKDEPRETGPEAPF